MNYRHSFHAGNFADVMKHALIVRILLHLARKETPFRVVDTHAGIGRYDLAGPDAQRTREGEGGIERLGEPLAPDAEALLAPYRAVVAATRARHGPTAYPGSPAIIREMLRRDDRAVFVEKHPEDAATLRERFNAVRNIKVLHLDGWVALGSLVPPKERRGLVLVDPPYEEPHEGARAVARMAHALGKWPTGIFALWYAVKQPAGADALARDFARAVSKPALRLELAIGAPADSPRLGGSGMIVVNPPWTLASEAETLLPALAERLAVGVGAGCRIEPLGGGR